MKLFYTIGLLMLFSLMLSGCVSEAEPQDASEEIEEETGEAEETTEEETEDETGEAEETVEAVQWGNECEGLGDCAYDELEACVYGYCVVQECLYLSDCPPGTGHCFDGECISEEELYEKFEQCDPSTEECTQTCENCIKGDYKCIVTGASTDDVVVEYHICVECISEYSCEEGYRCVHYHCVPGPGT